MVLLVGGGWFLSKTGAGTGEHTVDPAVPVAPVVPPVVGVKPPWWILQGIVPHGTEKDMGGWTASTFSKHQQERFGVDEQGAILDQSKFDAAVAETAVTAQPAWWIIAKVKPEGPVEALTGAGGENLRLQDNAWAGATFSDEQQKQYGINKAGVVLEEMQFGSAIGKTQLLPPWWIMHHVTPDEALQLASWKACAFSKAQQDTFGVDALGVILDQGKFDAGIAALGANFNAAIGKMQQLPPWWIVHHVIPEGPQTDMETWTRISFSQAQQDEFGVDDFGVVLDQTKFASAVAAEDAKPTTTTTTSTTLTTTALTTSTLTTTLPPFFFLCDLNGVQELILQYTVSRIDTTNGADEIGRFLMDDATYTVPVFGTYRGKEAIVNDYLKANDVIPSGGSQNYRNEKILPGTILEAGKSAEGFFTFDAWKVWWHNGKKATASLTCVDSHWMVKSIVVV